MEREIKFRGQDENGVWHYGGIIYYNDGRVAITENDPTWTDDGFHNDEFDVIFVKPETVGQFTGLTDKNGKEIYEGDIVGNPIIKNPGNQQAVGVKQR